MNAEERLSLPDYRQPPAEVKARFSEIYERPVKLEVRGLGKTFDTPDKTITALHDINFKVHRREFVSVIGPSGCGKSTLLRILAGLEFPTSGQALLDNEAILGPGSDRGMVFQSYTLFPWLNVKRNVMFGLEVNGRTAFDAEREAMDWIKLVGLEKFAESYPSQLSGGMKQRVAIARALANQPKILFMDEPFGALDAQTRANMQAYLLEIWRNVDVTIMFITHDLDEAIYLSDRILVLKAHPGEVQEFIEVPVARPRNPDQFLSPYFLSTKYRLEELIHPKPQTENIPQVMRMTNVGDNPE